jgi:MoxR-like ATPase
MEELKTLEELQNVKQEIFNETHKVIVGQDKIIEEILIGLFAGGHCLLIGVPGLAKTLMIKTLSQILDLQFKRIQFTPDLMPSDITGTEIIQEDKVSRDRALRFIPGPVFANLVLADEINRAPPKTQAALLEAMQEFNVTVGGKIYPLPYPFFVLATQNPIELEGTYPLPEAQLDRFMLSITIDYPDGVEEKKIVELTTSISDPNIKKIISGEDIRKFQAIVRAVPVSDYVIGYGVNLVRSTRPGEKTDSQKFIKEYVSWGAGPRAAQHLILSAKARAAMRGDVNVSIADVKAVSESVLKHRIFTNFNADAEGMDSGKIVRYLLEAIKENS